ISRKPAAAAPSAGGMAGTNIRPLAEISLTQNYCSSAAQFLRDHGVLQRLSADQSKRSGCSHHLVGGIDVVFDQHRNAVHWPARTLGLALLIQRLRNG